MMDEAKEEATIEELLRLAVATGEHLNVSLLLTPFFPPVLCLYICLSVQEVLCLFHTKNRFLRRIIPRLRSIGELVREKKEAKDRAEKAEIRAQEAIEAKLKALQEDNRRLRDQNLELTDSALGKALIPTAFSSMSLVIILKLVLA